ncbi:MAG: GH3 auxin-responsive promoter family protein [Cyanobacteria bacterium P01_H01_bin.21]
MRWLIKAFGALLAPTAHRFYQTLSKPKTTQQSLQTKLFQQFVRSDYGQSLNITSIDDWHQIPIITYEDISPWLNPEQSSDPILFYEKTSGSSGPAKRIPYTRALRKSFNTLFCIWAYDLITHGPKFETGKVYMCISPKLLSPDETAEGLEEDSDYLDPWLRWLLKPFLVSPPDAHQPQPPEIFQANLCKTLLLEENLETISIWSPSFLSVQLDYIQTHRQQLRSQLQLSPTRAELLTHKIINWEALWPKLKLISCWDSAMAADQVSSLKTHFPNTLIQGKGLLATEAPMTVPLVRANGCVPLLNEVFFEFEDDAGQIYLLHELELGQTYSVIISQKGGLYRYRMCDRIQPTHYYRATPCLRFLGRNNATSDMVGEKLTLDFTHQALSQLALPPTAFKCLVPSLKPHPRYTLLTDCCVNATDQLATTLEQELLKAFHYRQARLLGQLEPVEIIVKQQVQQQLSLYYYSQGKRLGNIKYPCLVSTPIELQWFSAQSNNSDW